MQVKEAVFLHIVLIPWLIRGCLLCVQRHLPSPIGAAAAAYWCSEIQPRPRENRSPCGECKPESWNYSSWILASNTRAKNWTLRESCWDLMWQSWAGCLFSISSRGRHIHQYFPISRPGWDFCSGLTQRKGCHSVNHRAISLSFGVFLRDLNAHAGAILPDGWSHQDGCTESNAAGRAPCRQGTLQACLLPEACTSKHIHMCLTLHFWGIIPLI